VAGEKEIAAVELETRVGGGKVAHIDQGVPGGKPQVGTKDAAEGVTAEVPHGDDIDGEVRTKIGVGLEKPEGEADKEDAAGEAEGDELEALPDYDPDKPETIEAYDAAYLKDGAPDLSPEGRFSTEWFANAKKSKDGVGTLNESTYKYLEGLGYSRDAVKRIEAGQVALNTSRLQSLYSQAGGEEQYGAMIAWARGGGYDEAARKRYNEALDSEDPARISEAVAALKAKYSAANPGGRAPASRLRRPNRPARTVEGGGGGAGGVQGFKDHAEYREARAKALGPEGSQAEFDLVRKRLQASDWYKKR
jgi:hypothetical protein